MSFTTYSALQTTIADYLVRSDLTNPIKDFITLAEVRLNRDLRIRQMLTYTTLTMTAATSTVTVPSDFLQLRDMHINTTPISSLEYQSPSAFFRNTRATDSGTPKQFTNVGSSFTFAPKPDSAYVLQILYYAKPAVLSDGNTSNVWLANCPDALLYASMAEAETYLMNDARLQYWAALYDKAIGALTTSDDSSENSGSPLSISVASR